MRVVRKNVDLAELYAVLHRMEYLLGALVALMATHTGLGMVVG